MEHHDSDATQIKASGWHQGSVLPGALIRELSAASLLPWPVSNNQLLVVVSHDCDATNPSFDVEPEVELLRATILPRSQAEGAYFWGKNPRTYHLEDNSSGTTVVWQFSVHDRIRVPRRLLLGHAPDSTRVLDPQNIRRLALWLARRYVRAAFPDAFVARIRPAVDRLRTRLKREGSLLTAIYILVADEELPDSVPYEPIIWASVRVEDYSDAARRARTQELLDKVEAAVQDCDGIEVKHSLLVSEAELSLDDLRRLKRWDFDDLTIRGEAITEPPPES